jgi:hypothetical protein
MDAFPALKKKRAAGDFLPLASFIPSRRRDV